MLVCCLWHFERQVSFTGYLLLEVCTIICLGVKGHLVSGHEISRLQHGLQLIMARYTRIINCRPCCNLYIINSLTSAPLAVTPLIKVHSFYRIFTWTDVHVRYMPSPVRLSVVCLSVQLVHPTQAVGIFGNISMVFGTLAIHWHPQKILWRSSQGNPSA